MVHFWLTRDEVRSIDRQAFDHFGISGLILMENAGRGCAELLMRLDPERNPVVILCGPGNNGGDGFVIARHLDNHGWPTSLLVFAAKDSLKGDAAVNQHIVGRCGLDLRWCEEATDEVERTIATAGWIVDALFGTGLTRPLGPPFDRVVSLVAGSGRPVLAVDIPSGLDCDSGEPLGPTIEATHTATFVAHKRGFLAPGARDWTGEVHVVDIGAPRVLVQEYRQRPLTSPWGGA
jgi:NAD(P)H-hydrate epimerase